MVTIADRVTRAASFAPFDPIAADNADAVAADGESDESQSAASSGGPQLGAMTFSTAECLKILQVVKGLLRNSPRCMGSGSCSVQV